MATPQNKSHRFSVPISWLILLYFIILFAERAQSIVRIIADDSVKFFATGYDGYVNILTIVSMLLTILLLTTRYNRSFFKSLTDPETVPVDLVLSFTAGTLLLGGMVHTEFTIAPMQFGAYGALIVAMILRTVELCGEREEKARLWYGLLFLITFSMAIPVMYHSYGSTATVYHIFAAITAIVLVIEFTMLMSVIFTGEDADLLQYKTFILMVVLDTLVFALRWNEEVNTFALIFAIAAAVLFVIGKLIFREKK